jgi:hypothetical protein
MRILTLFFIVCSLPSGMYAQGCCSGGSGSPIAGGASQGVLQDRQMEIAANFQYLSSDRFKTRDKDTAQLFASYQTQYLYYKLAYGVTKDLTVSLETGYFLHKTQTGLYDSVLNKSEIIRSSGIADLIIFPRYDVINRTTEKKRVELTLGLGYKIPLGKYNDSMLVYTNPNTGQQIFTTAPPLVQPTNGSQDLIGYLFFYHGFPEKNFRLFTNVLYIRKGWNPLGEKFGDYASLGLFAGQTFFEKLGVTLQVKGEHVGKLKAANNVDLLALYNVDTASTGSEKISFVPQVSFTHKAFTVFALADIPVYEYVYGTQVASRHQFTFGIAYRFFTYRSIVPKDGQTLYECPMKCNGYTGKEPGKCTACGMDLMKK